MKGWLNTRLGKEIDLKTGFPFKSAQYSDAPTDIRLLRGDNIVQGKLRWDDVQRWPKEDVDAYEDYLLAKGDVVLAMDRPWIEAGLKYACLSEDDVPCLQVQRTARLRGKGRLRTDYLRYIIAGERFTRYVKQVNTGSNVPHISAAQIRDFQVLIPPPDDQERIANVLSVLDAKIELNNRINAELEAVAKLVYDYWFVQFDFPITAAQAAAMGKPKLEGKPYRASGGKMIYNEALKREIPDGWKLNFVKDLAPVLTGKEDANHATEYGCYHFFTCGDEELRCDDFKFEGKTVLIAGNGNFSVKFFDGKFNAYQRTYVLIPHDKVTFALIYFAIVDSIRGLTQGSRGSIVKFLTKGDIEDVAIPLPSQPDVEIFWDSLNSILSEVLVNRSQNHELTELRDWLLPMLMNGQVTIGYEE